MPKVSYWNTGSLINNSIYLTGFLLPDLLIYDDQKNDYQPVCKLEPYKSKIMIENWILVHGCDHVLEVNETNIVSYKLENPWIGYYLLISCGFRRGKWIYFLEGFDYEKEGYFLKRFDTVLKKIEKVEFFSH